MSDSEEQLPEKSLSKDTVDNVEELHVESALTAVDSKTDRIEDEHCGQDGLPQHDAQSAKQDSKKPIVEWERWPVVLTC